MCPNTICMPSCSHSATLKSPIRFDRIQNICVSLKPHFTILPSELHLLMNLPSDTDVNPFNTKAWWLQILLTCNLYYTLKFQGPLTELKSTDESFMLGFPYTCRLTNDQPISTAICRFIPLCLTPFTFVCFKSCTRGSLTLPDNTP